MSRIQFALNVTDIDQAVELYSKLFDAGPSERKPGYTKTATWVRDVDGAPWEFYVKTGDAEQMTNTVLGNGDATPCCAPTTKPATPE